MAPWPTVARLETALPELNQSAQARARRAGERGGAAGARSLAEVEKAWWIWPASAVARRGEEWGRSVLTGGEAAWE